MDFKSGDLSPVFTNLYFWITFCGLWLGAALAALSVIPARKKFPEKARVRKWILFCLSLSGFCLTVLCTLLIFSFSSLNDFVILYYLAGAVCMFFLSLRFKKSIGVFFLVIVLSISFVWLLVTAYWIPVTAETKLVEYKVLSGDEESVQVECRCSVREMPEFLEWPSGTRFSVRILQFDEMIWIGSGTFYIVDDFINKENQRLAMVDQQDTTLSIRFVAGVIEQLERWNLAQQKYLQSDVLPLVLLEPYSVYFSPDFEIKIRTTRLD